ncbi:hypothetical protein Tco_0211589 [Tanacetum coccineum]
MLRKDPPSLPTEFYADVCHYLATNPAPFRKFLEPFLCFVGISQYYTLDDSCYQTFLTDNDKGGCSLFLSFNFFSCSHAWPFLFYTKIDLFAFIHHADPTKVRIRERKVGEGEVPFLKLTKGYVILLAGVNDQENQNEVVRNKGVDVVNEEGDDETQAIVTNKPKRVRKKRKAADDVSGSGLPPKKLKEDHSAFGDVGASTVGKSLAALQGLLDSSTLAMKVGATAKATVPFVTSFVTPTPERKDGGHVDSITRPNLRTQLATERFVVLSDYSHHSSTNAADDEVTFIIRSSMPHPLVLTAVVTTTIIDDATSALAPRIGTEPVLRSIFEYFASICEANQDVAGPSHPAGTELSTYLFFVSQDMDSENLHQTYIPKWNVTNDSTLDESNICHGVIDHLAHPALFSQLQNMDYEQLFVKFNVGAARQTCLSSEVRLRLEHELRGRGKFEGKCAMQADWLKERDAELASLKPQLSLKEAEATMAIRLCCQIAIVEVVEAARSNELNGLKEQNAALEGHVATLESAALFCDKLSTIASALEFKKDKLIDQVSTLEGTCSRLRDEVMGYKLFKKQIEAVQDEEMRVLSEKVVDLDAELMRMATHLDEEFYPRYLITIVGRRWIHSRGVRLVVMKCLQSPGYLASLGGAIGRAIDKGIQGGLAAGVDHGKAERGLADIATYDPFAEANFVSAVNALRSLDFPLLVQLASQKDASIADIMGLLHLEGPTDKTPKAS